MRALYTLLAIITVMVGSAQTSRSNVVTVTPFSSDGTFYLQMQGRTNPETNCFEGVNAGTSYSIDYQGDGLDGNVFIDEANYRVVHNDLSFINSNVNRWSQYNRTYDANYVHLEGSDLLDCPDGQSWELAPNNVEWFVNSQFSGWAYIYYVDNSGRYHGTLTNRYQGFTAALHQSYTTGDLNVPFNNNGGYGNLASLEAAIEGRIAAYDRIDSITWTEAPCTTSENSNLCGRSTVGAHSYTITYPFRSTQDGVDGLYVEASWIFYLTPTTYANSNPHFFAPVETTSYYYHATSSTRFDDLDAVRAHFGETTDVRLRDGHVVKLFDDPTPDDVRAAQDVARTWIEADLLRSTVGFTYGQ